MVTFRFNQQWYGARAKVLAQDATHMVVDYGCEGQGIVTSFALFAGIQLCFLEFNTDEVLRAQTFNPDIVQITYCRNGRYECEFADHTVTYLPSGHFSVAKTAQLPISFSFPLGHYSGVSLVIDRQAVDETTRQVMQVIPIGLDQLGRMLEIDSRWYVAALSPAFEQLFSALYAEKASASLAYYRIKALELLYYTDQLTKQSGYTPCYFDKQKIEATKAIRDYLVSHLDENVSLASMAKAAHLSLSSFYQVFSNIYGETPYAYLKKYKMNLAAQWLVEKEMRVGDIALELGYSNASKFSKAFHSVYGILPKDYRKNW